MVDGMYKITVLKLAQNKRTKNATNSVFTTFSRLKKHSGNLVLRLIRDILYVRHEGLYKITTMKMVMVILLQKAIRIKATKRVISAKARSFQADIFQR